MNIKLINELNPNYNITQQILHNRGIKDEELTIYTMFFLLGLKINYNGYFMKANNMD